jgi:UDP-glucuronate decarboxylase
LTETKKSKIVFSELPEDDPKQRNPDLEIAVNILEWFPVVDLKEGLQRTIQYFSNKNSIWQTEV